MRHRFGEVHVAAAAYVNHCVAGDNSLFRPASAITGLIVEHGSKPEEKTFLEFHRGENPAGGRIDRQNGTIRIAERIYRDAAHDSIVIYGYIVFCRLPPVGTP